MMRSVSRTRCVVLVQTLNVQRDIFTWASVVQSLLMRLHSGRFPCRRVYVWHVVLVQTLDVQGNVVAWASLVHSLMM